ncbi:MAG: V4R domain-containing protein [Candidatus Freyrarchaeum guaymaensis]|nr:V4R domain-containing protein [Candidatus Sigynarchaeota archaeon]
MIRTLKIDAESLKELLKLDCSTGKLTFNGERVWLTRPEMIGFIQKWIVNLAGESLLESVYEAGKECAQKDFEILKRMMELPEDIKSLLEVLSSFYASMGWGKISVETVEKDKIIFTLENSPIASVYEHSDITVCGYFSGYSAGLISKATNRDWNAVEIECEATGKPKCRFQIGEKTRKQLLMEKYSV